MNTNLLAIVVVALYAAGISLAALSLLGLQLQIRRDNRRKRALEELRAPFEAHLLHGSSPPQPGSPRRELLLDLALRYTDSIRGKEAERINDLLEREGLISDLLKDMTARSAWRRASAADALGRLRISRAVPALIQALNDESEDVRIVAARSLAAIGDPRAVPYLAKALQDPSRWTLSLIAENLMRMGPAVVEPLLELLEHKEHNVRVAAVQVLGEIRDPRATSALSRILRSEEPLNLRAQAAASLGKLGGAEAEIELLATLADAQWEVRSQAAKALGRLANPLSAPALAEAMSDTSWWVRVNCAEALARLGEAGHRQLTELLEHPDPYVRDQSRAALDAYGLRTYAHAAPSTATDRLVATPTP